MATVLPPSPAIAHYALQVFTSLQDIYGDDYYSDFNAFFRDYSPILAEQLGIAEVAHPVVLNTRLNPLSSVHTQLVVNTNEPGWYETLCKDLGAKALTSRLGKPLTEFTSEALHSLDSIKVVYEKPLKLEGSARFEPLAAPIKYAANRTDYAETWLQLAVDRLAFQLAEKLQSAIPTASMTTEHLLNVKDLSLQHLDSAVAKKKSMQAILNEAVNSLPSILEGVSASAKTKEELMKHMYKSLVSVVTKYRDSIGESFVMDTLLTVNDHIERLASGAGAAPTTKAAVTISSDLFADVDEEVSVQSSMARTQGLMNLQTMTLIGDALAESLDTNVEGIIDKLNPLSKENKAKRAAKNADKKANKAEEAAGAARREAERRKEEVARIKRLKEEKKKQRASKGESSSSTLMASVIGEALVSEATNTAPIQLLIQVSNDCFLAHHHGDHHDVNHHHHHPAPAMTPKEEKKKEKEEQPTMKAAQTLMAAVAGPAVAVPDSYPRLSLSEINQKYGSSHAAVCSYLARKMDDKFPANRTQFYIHSDKLFGSGASVSTVRQSLTKSPTSTSSNIHRVVIPEISPNYIFHIVN